MAHKPKISRRASQIIDRAMFMRLRSIRIDDEAHPRLTTQPVAMGHSSEVTTARYQHVIGHHEAVNNFAPPMPDGDEINKL